MINEHNERIMITLSKKQIAWLKAYAKKRGLSVSKLISYLLTNNIDQLYNIITGTNQELKELIRIAKIKWVDK